MVTGSLNNKYSRVFQADATEIKRERVQDGKGNYLAPINVTRIYSTGVVPTLWLPLPPSDSSLYPSTRPVPSFSLHDPLLHPSHASIRARNSPVRARYLTSTSTARKRRIRFHSFRGRRIILCYPRNSNNNAATYANDLSAYAS